MFSDLNRYRHSSCGVHFFSTPAIPRGYVAESVFGFVEELVVNDEKLKHVEIHVNFFRQYVQAGHIKLAKIASAENPADALTKSYATRASFQAAIAHFMRELPFRFRPTTQSSG